MAGIYFHIPYCRSKCHYCDFYSSNNISTIDQLVNSQIKELYLRKNYLGSECVETIYFGGGTPSVLSQLQIQRILLAVRENFVISSECEITFEANPEDLNFSYLNELYELGINRLSIGIQSFDKNVLVFLGRRHNNSIVYKIIDDARSIGFSNISLDLIYGIPGLSLESYMVSLNEVIKLNPQHISAYALTIEEYTYFNKLLKKGQLVELSDELVSEQFNATIDTLVFHGYSHYEVSNFALERFNSRHNSAYWQNLNYLGIGPSAHSYNGVSRQWNLKSTKNYCSNLDNDEVFFEIEFLSEIDRYNEYILLGLRTDAGISRLYIQNNFNDIIFNYFSSEIVKLNLELHVFIFGDTIKLSRKGILISDLIIRKLFYT